MSHRSVSSLPTPDNDVASFVVTEKGSKDVDYLTVIYQRSGNVIDAIYYNVPRRPKADEITVVVALATVTGSRIATS